MGTKSRETIYGSSIRASAERAAEARKVADKLACEAWNKRMLGFQGPAQPSPALGDALNAGFRYLEVKCLGCNTHQTVPLDIVRRPKATPVHELERYMRCKDCSQVRGYPYKRSHLVALRSTKITADHRPRLGGRASGELRFGCMDGEATTIGGIVIPSTDPLFLAVVIGVHIPLGIACVITGASAMLSRKGRGRHSRFGTIYFWCLLALFVSATLLSVMRWSENYHLFILGAVAFGCAWFGRSALQLRWREWVRLHITGMSLSYVVMLIAFYVDNGKQLPVWKELPHFACWLLPLVVATPLIVWALLRHPMVLRMKHAAHL